jgi:transposase
MLTINGSCLALRGMRATAGVSRQPDRQGAWLDSQRDWLTVERLPAYAPELNAVEYLWANLKDVELANLPITTLAEVADATQQGIQRVCERENLVVGFLAHTGLTLNP